MSNQISLNNQDLKHAMTKVIENCNRSSMKEIKIFARILESVLNDFSHVDSNPTAELLSLMSALEGKNGANILGDIIRNINSSETNVGGKTLMFGSKSPLSTDSITHNLIYPVHSDIILLSTTGDVSPTDKGRKIKSINLESQKIFQLYKDGNPDESVANFLSASDSQKYILLLNNYVDDSQENLGEVKIHPDDQSKIIYTNSLSKALGDNIIYGIRIINEPKSNIYENAGVDGKNTLIYNSLNSKWEPGLTNNDYELGLTFSLTSPTLYSGIENGTISLTPSTRSPLQAWNNFYFHNDKNITNKNYIVGLLDTVQNSPLGLRISVSGKYRIVIDASYQSTVAVTSDTISKIFPSIVYRIQGETEYNDLKPYNPASDHFTDFFGYHKINLRYNQVLNLAVGTYNFFIKGNALDDSITPVEYHDSVGFMNVFKVH